MARLYEKMFIKNYELQNEISSSMIKNILQNITFLQRGVLRFLFITQLLIINNRQHLRHFDHHDVM